jgi:Flp pilus assembly protein CpaB
MAVLAGLQAPRLEKRTLIAVGLAALAAFIVLTLTRPDTSVGVLVAAGDLPVGVALDADLVAVRQVANADGLVPGSGVGELEGWTLAAGIRKGEPLLPSLLVDPDAVPRPSALSIAIPETHAALGSVVAGDIVDIYVTWPATPGESRRTELLVPGVEVLESRPASDAVGGARTIELLFAVDTELAPLIAGGHRIGDLDLVRVSR